MRQILLGFIGPYEVFVRADCFKVVTAFEYDNTNLKAEGGFTFQADHNFLNCPVFDILFIPGGRSITSLLTNEVYLHFIKSRASHCGHLKCADRDIVETVKRKTKELFQKRQVIISSLLDRTT